jgi:D-alanyl-D-alanine carboxypeptidase
MISRSSSRATRLCVAGALVGVMALAVTTASASPRGGASDSARPIHAAGRTYADRSAVRRAAGGVLAAGAPGVLVTYRDDRGSWSVRRGVASIAAGGAIRRDGYFRIGSVTKTYLASAVLQAVGRRRLSLDDTLARWLPGVLPKLREDRITLRMLLDHTSGVPDPTPRLLRHPKLFGRGPVTPAGLVATARNLEPVAPPGREFSYSNADYWLAAMILERATGRTYTDEIAAGILRPLNLRHTVLPHSTTRLRAPFLHGYSRRPGQPPADVSAFDASWGSSSGGIVATTDDLNRFSRALLSGRVLTPAQLREMKHGVAVPATPMGVRRDGLGLTMMRLGCGRVLYGNMGGLPGYTAWMLSSASGRRQIAVAATTDELARIDRAIHSVVEAAFCR